MIAPAVCCGPDWKGLFGSTELSQEFVVSAGHPLGLLMDAQCSCLQYTELHDVTMDAGKILCGQAAEISTAPRSSCQGYIA